MNTSYTIEDIDKTMKAYMDNQELPGGALIIRKNGEIVYKNKWGYADISQRKKIQYNSVYRMMSMSKCITAVGIMQLIEQGKLELDDAIDTYIPEFKNMRVSIDKRYQFKESMNMLSLLPKIPFFKMDKIKSEPAKRSITIRDLLSHSSGLEQGLVGMIAMVKDKSQRISLEDQAKKYSKYVLGFHPGTDTGYSPLAGFDILARIIEIVSGMSADAYFKSFIFDPLEMASTTFSKEDISAHLVHVYKRKKGILTDVTDTKDDMGGILHHESGYICGSGGLYSTVEDYEHFAHMLVNNGMYKGKKILKPETVVQMHTEAPLKHMEPEPGMVWGLGMCIRQNPQKGRSFATKGTYGWSGAFGTHFFISPKDHMEAVWVVNRTDLNGSGSYISAKVEELIFSIFAESQPE